MKKLSGIVIIIVIYIILSSVEAKYYCDDLCWEEAQSLLSQGHSYLDGDSDGEACEQASSCGGGSYSSYTTKKIIDTSCNKYPGTTYNGNMCNCPGDSRGSSSRTSTNWCGKTINSNLLFTSLSTTIPKIKKENTIDTSCNKYPGTIYRENDKMCACVNDKAGTSSRTKEYKCSPTPKPREELQETCNKTRPGTIYNEKSKSCECESKKGIRYKRSSEFSCRLTEEELLAETHLKIIESRFDSLILTDNKCQSQSNLNLMYWDQNNKSNNNDILILKCSEYSTEFRKYKLLTCDYITNLLDEFSEKYISKAINRTIRKHDLLYEDITKYCGE